MEDPHIEPVLREVDGLGVDAAGVPIHVEFQTRADTDIGGRMAGYCALLRHRWSQPLEQHLVLLHPDADRGELGEYRWGGLQLTYHVHRVWERDPDELLARTGLLRFVPLARATGPLQRAELLGEATETITKRLRGPEAIAELYWAGQLASLYLSRAVISETLEGSHMPIDLSHTEMSQSFRAEGLAEGRAEGRAEGEANARRDAIRRIVIGRFGDTELADRTAEVTEGLLQEAIDVTISAASAAEITAWLQTQRA